MAKGRQTDNAAAPGSRNAAGQVARNAAANPENPMEGLFTVQMTSVSRGKLFETVFPPISEFNENASGFFVNARSRLVETLEKMLEELTTAMLKERDDTIATLNANLKDSDANLKASYAKVKQLEDELKSANARIQQLTAVLLSLKESVIKGVDDLQLA